MHLFPHLNAVQVQTFCIQFFNNVDDWKQFKGGIRDLMIATRSYSSAQNDFYEFEKKQEEEKALELE